MHPAPPTSPRPRARSLALALVVLAVTAYVLRYVLLPFVVAGALAYVATPVVNRFHRKSHAPRWVGSVAIFLVYLALFALAGVLVAKVALPQLVAVTQDLPGTLHRFLTILFRGEELHTLGATLDATQLSQKLTAWRPASGDLSNPRELIDLIGMGVAGVMGLILTLVLLAYFLIEGPRLARGAVWLVPPAHRPLAARVAARSAPLLYRYVVGMFVVVAFATGLTWLFARFFLHLPHAELLAVAVGLLEMIPMAGPVLSVMMIAIVAIEQVTPGMIVSVAVFTTVLRVMLDQFVAPIVLGKAVDLPPPVVIFAFLAGGVIYGPLGLILAIPAVGVGKIVVEEMYREQTDPKG